MLYIFQLINYETGEVIPYEPHLAPQVAEITNAESRAVEAARLAQCRARLTNLLPVTGPRRETGARGNDLHMGIIGANTTANGCARIADHRSTDTLEK